MTQLHPVRPWLHVPRLLLLLTLAACSSSPGSGVIGPDPDPDTGAQDALPQVPDADNPPSLPDTGVDAAPDVDAGPPEGDLGEPCERGSDCDSGLCLRLDPALDEGFCSDACEESSECPEGWRCVTFTDTGRDAVRRCVPQDICIDRDGDGFGVGPGCRGVDCDDADPLTFTGADELCNGVDNNCNGRIDDNPVDERRACDTGFPGRCGPGLTLCDGGTLLCQASAPAAVEVCDGLDNDCNGEVDEGGVCEGAPCCWQDRCEGVCATARQDANGACTEPAAWGAEVCDGLDNDCDGLVDEGVRLTFWPDADLDTWGDPTGPVEACSAPAGHVDRAGDCNDADPAIRPDAVEVCDGIDNNCSGAADDGGVCAGQACCWLDRCEGVCALARTDATGACTAPASYAAAEVCDGLDNDCDGVVDNGVLRLFWPDVDEDGYGDRDAAAVAACAAPAGWVPNDLDCDDTRRSVNPDALERCDGLDTNCDGRIDEGFALGVACAAGQGVCRNEGVTVCTADGLATRCGAVAGEAGGAELCDGLDNNCDGRIDEGNPGGDAACSTGQPGVCAAGRTACRDGGLACDRIQGPAEEVCDGLDNNCDGQIDENNPGGGDACLVPGQQGLCRTGVRTCQGGVLVCRQTVFPVAEACDGQDNDCDGTIDNGNPGGNLACSASGLQGVCAAGRTACSGGSVACQQVNFPSAEVCDGQDNDCDGTVDNGNPGGGGGCAVAGQQGVCAEGTRVCSGGSLTCQQVNFPSAEVCDGRDNNCNGAVDEGNPGGGGGCAVAGQQGVCAEGTRVCSGGSLTCQQVNFPSAEVCDGRDNNCNGTVDEGNPGGGLACVNSGLQGLCRNGLTACQSGAITCTQTVFPSTEVCDGLDNNCNGSIDEGNPGGGAACATGQSGICSAGSRTCTGGSLQCVRLQNPSAEVCDGLDNDCNGLVDDNAQGVGTACTLGALQGVCRSGRQVCSGGSLSCSQVNFPSTEVCDGLDNNCNGSVDEGNPGGGAACTTGQSGVCSPGTRTCTSGSLQCIRNVNPTTEICDGLDNNCNGSVDEGNPGGGASCNTGQLGICAAGTTACTSGSVVCNRNQSPVTEICGDGLDNNCNGTVDEGCPVCRTTRTRVRIDDFLVPTTPQNQAETDRATAIRAAFTSRGATVTTSFSLGSSALANLDVIVFNGIRVFLAGNTGTDLQNWLQTGGTAFIYMSNIETSCNRVNNEVLNTITPSFDCSTTRFGTANSFGTHPLTTSLTSALTPYLDGVGIGSGGTTLASISAVPVYKVYNVGCGRVVLFGDSDQWNRPTDLTGTNRFWSNLAAFLLNPT
jgi:hypothetical protein